MMKIMQIGPNGPSVQYITGITREVGIGEQVGGAVRGWREQGLLQVRRVSIQVNEHAGREKQQESG